MSGTEDRRAAIDAIKSDLVEAAALKTLLDEADAHPGDPADAEAAAAHLREAADSLAASNARAAALLAERRARLAALRGGR